MLFPNLVKVPKFFFSLKNWDIDYKIILTNLKVTNSVNLHKTYPYLKLQSWNRFPHIARGESHCGIVPGNRYIYYLINSNNSNYIYTHPAPDITLCI